MYIVFGSSGFIGRSLTANLIKRFGQNKIICIDRKSSSSKLNKIVDLCKKKLNFNLGVSKAKTAYILSSASRVITDSIHEEKKQIRINKKIIDNILKILKKIRIKNIVYFNSSSVYSSFNKKPLNENQKLKPSIALGKSKFYGENKLSEYCKIKKIKFLSLRIFTVYGPKMSEHQFIPQVIKKFYSKKKNITFWNKETKRSFIYINDLIKIIEKLTLRPLKSRLIINIGGLKLYKVKDIINIISKITKIKKKITYLNTKNNFDHIIDFSKFKKNIKRFKFTPLEKGLIKTINDF